MKERPILFSGPMVRALLDGSKTQTRRVVKPQPDTRPGMNCTRLVFKDRKGAPLLDEALEADPRLYVSLCPYGQPGDKLWVRESFIHNAAEYEPMMSMTHPLVPAETFYMADHNGDARGLGWKPSIHMPRALSRITLEITGVRVERLQDISDADSLAEGVDRTNTSIPGYAKERYCQLWESINGPDSWDANPWVWVVEFKRSLP